MPELKENAKVTAIQGHIILYCKSHYRVKDVSYIEGLKRIWAIRCGYDYNEADNSMLEYIANELFNIIYEICNIDIIDFQKKLHNEICNTLYQYEKDNLPIVRVIHYYRHQIAFLQVCDYNKEKNKKKTLIKLPTPKKRLFKRILEGKGVYSDYNLISK